MRLDILTPDIALTRRGDDLFLASRTPLPSAARAVGDWLVARATETPERVFLAERSPQVSGGSADGRPPWRTLSYGDALRRVEGLASALLQRGATPTRPVAILSDNGIDAALVGLAAMHVGVPVATVSSAYSLMSAAFVRLRAALEALDPSLVFVADAARYGRAIDALALDPSKLLHSGGDPTHGVDALVRTPPSSAMRAAFIAITPDTVAKILFTSGSTGTAKGVVNTQRMLTANQEMIAATWPFLARTPPVVVDWLPWSHTFGGNHNFFMVLRNAGTLHIDAGRPAPGMVETTVANMRDVRPNLWFNVPRGFDQALPLLEGDEATRREALSRVELVFYAAAALSPGTRARLEEVLRSVGRDAFFTSAWGSTETAPMATSAHFSTATTGILGVPAPGVEIKLARVEDRHEIRVRGPNVTPGYWTRGGARTPPQLDADGYLRTGDAARLDDPARPERGLVFEGRLGENFKLSSGSWVSVGELRILLVEACAPNALDVVIAGHDRESLGILVLPSAAARQRTPELLRDALYAALREHNRSNPGASTRVARALVVDAPLSLDDGETTDKGYTNQRRVLERRAASVARLFADPSDADVVVLE